MKRAYLGAVVVIAWAVLVAWDHFRERPVVATWPEWPAEDDALPPFDPRCWPLVSDNLTSAAPGWYDWRLSRGEWEALG